MPARAGNTTYIPGVGATTRGKSGAAKKFTGKGPGPSGTTKTAEPTIDTVPVVTVSPSGKTTTANFKSQRAATRAKRQARATKRKTKAILHSVAQSKQRTPVKAELPKRSTESYTSSPAKATISPAPDPQAKPPTFEGMKTAGTPTVKELKTAKKAGTLRINQKGFATTPQVRQVAGTVKRLTKKAKRSSGPLPGLDAEGTRVARKVLKTGKGGGATYKDLLAAAETGLVESSGFHNLHEGDADSEGWRQERTSIYGSDATHPKQGALNFFSEAKQQTGATAGELAANVQRPAEQYRDRYDAVKPQAVAILKAFEKGTLKPAQRKKLAVAQAKAEKLGLKVANPSKVGPPPKKVVTRFKAIKAAADALESKNFPYSWGGGHDASFSPGGEGENGGPGYDCSGSVSYVLHKAGVLDTPLTSGDIGSVLKPGPGAVTVFYNAEHTFMRIGNEYWGTSVGDSGAGGIGKHPAPSADYLSQYSVGHVPGLGRKQALQLGFKDLNVGGASSFPGMTFSSGGATATIDPGAGTTNSGKPGFSKMPIQLTPQQKVNRTNRKLKALGVGDQTATSQPSGEAPSGIAALEKKYGHATV